MISEMTRPVRRLEGPKASWENTAAKRGAAPSRRAKTDNFNDFIDWRIITGTPPR